MRAFLGDGNTKKWFFVAGEMFWGPFFRIIYCTVLRVGSVPFGAAIRRVFNIRTAH